jgi:hypothetical protein
MCTGATSYSIIYKKNLLMTAGEARDRIKEDEPIGIWKKENNL